MKKYIMLVLATLFSLGSSAYTAPFQAQGQIQGQLQTQQQSANSSSMSSSSAGATSAASIYNGGTVYPAIPQPPDRWGDVQFRILEQKRYNDELKLRKHEQRMKEGLALKAMNEGNPDYLDAQNLMRLGYSWEEVQQILGAQHGLSGRTLYSIPDTSEGQQLTSDLWQAYNDYNMAKGYKELQRYRQATENVYSNIQFSKQFHNGVASNTNDGRQWYAAENGGM